jgi:hypothetical protein
MVQEELDMESVKLVGGPTSADGVDVDPPLDSMVVEVLDGVDQIQIVGRPVSGGGVEGNEIVLGYYCRLTLNDVHGNAVFAYRRASKPNE